MRITLITDGGLASFPGLRAPRILDLDTLPMPERDRLLALAASARALRCEASSEAPGRDCRTYSLAIEDASGCTTLRVSDPVRDAKLLDLLEAVRTHTDARGTR